MPEPLQLTTEGRETPLHALLPHRSPLYAAEPLFTAPITLRGQMVLTPSEHHAAARCATLGRSS